MKYIYYLQILVIKLFFPKYWKLPASLVYAQAKHETGNFKSAIFKENKNFFGMKINSRSYDVGENRGHAKYLTHIDSILDYFARQVQFGITYNSDLDYMSQTQKSGYAEDTSYIKKWLYVYDQTKTIKYLGYLITPTFILAIWLIIKKI